MVEYYTSFCLADTSREEHQFISSAPYNQWNWFRTLFIRVVLPLHRGNNSKMECNLQTSNRYTYSRVTILSFIKLMIVVLRYIAISSALPAKQFIPFPTFSWNQDIFSTRQSHAVDVHL